jgi:signal peptidase I
MMGSFPSGSSSTLVRGEVRVRIGTVRVKGPSMVPALYDGGWLLASDNPYATGPTGVADVEARVLFLYRRGPR